MEEIAIGLNALALVVAILLWRFWLPKYFEEKAKNLAQKEDLNELTAITEEVRSRFSHGSIVFRAQFEAEFEMMQGVWTKAKRLKRAFVEAYPHPDFLPPTQEAFEQFVAIQIDFLDFLEGSRPFLPTTVLLAFGDFDELMTDMKVRRAKPLTRDEVPVIRGAVDAALFRVEASIRQRIEELRIVQ